MPGRVRSPKIPKHPKVLMIDVGGSNVKAMRTGGGRRAVKIPSGKKLTAAAMVDAVLRETKLWKYDCVTIGVPTLVSDGKLLRDPLNLGGGWVSFDFEG